jgi:nitrous oxidase accessory protein NosD
VLGAVFAAGASTSLAATEVVVDCGAGADLQAAINAAPKGAILDISGRCVGTFTVEKNLVLRGVSNAVLDAQSVGTTLTITAGHVRLAKLTVTGGDNQVGGVDTAGGIWNGGTLTLVRVTITGNRTEDGAPALLNQGTALVQRTLITQTDGDDFQGGIVNHGTATVDKSTISRNSGTGILNGNHATFTLIDSTVSGNVAAPSAGGVWNMGSVTILRSTIAGNASANSEGGGIFNTGWLAMTASTVVGNQGDDATGGLANYGTATVAATIIAGNTVAGYAWDCSGTITSNGYNLIGTKLAPFDQSCDFGSQSTDQVGGTTPIDPLVNALGNYGGPTQTVLPKPVSPVVNTIPVGATSADGTITLCPSSGTTDQRGVPRPQGGGCDIGSVERKPKE